MTIQYGILSNKQIDVFLPLLPENRQILRESGVYAVGAVKDGRACGVLILRADDLMADIQYLAVAENCRRQGIANGLIDFVCRNAWGDGTAVLTTFSAVDRNDPLCRLLTKRGDFTLSETEDYICRVSCEKLTGIGLPAAIPDGSRIESFYKLPEHVQCSFFSALKEEDLEFVRILQNEREWMLDPLCLCVEEKGEIRSVLFCQNQNGNVLLSFVYSAPGRAREMIMLVCRLRDLLVEAAHKVPYLYLAAVTPESRKLVETLLPHREVVRRFYTACWDMNTMGE